MSTDNRLRELELVKKVEQEKKLAEHLHSQQQLYQHPQLPQTQSTRRVGSDWDLSAAGAGAPAATTTTLLYINTDSSSSDLTSPLTPTFSQRGGHVRGSSSTSSIEIPPSTSSFSDSPASPTVTQAPHGSNGSNGTKSGKTQLPDVQEDPLERDDEDITVLADQLGLYACLCDEPCLHTPGAMLPGEPWTHAADDIDYDAGFMSDSDLETTMRSDRKQRGDPDSPLSGLTSRIGSKLPGIIRWRSTKRPNHTFTPASEPSLERSQILSRVPSRAPSSRSRSSSVSGPARRMPDRINEPPMPPTPALSFYDSTESISLPMPLDIEKANVRRSLERDRALATTPLLPPLMTDSATLQSASQQPSPLQSPTIAQSPGAEVFTPGAYSTPPLSTKPSISSFRPPLVSSLSAPVVATSDVVASIPNLLELHDAWSDRLGHANFTINPKPYMPAVADLATLRVLRVDWDQARINYTKHLVRTGEHYGTTSKTYALTEAKWAETERGWKATHDGLVSRIVASGTNDPAELQWTRVQDDVPAAVPRMLDAEGKFPDLGDEDIVGPMMRETFMLRSAAPDERQNGAAKFLKNLVGKVGLRK